VSPCLQLLCDYFEQFGTLMTRCQETIRQSEYFMRAAAELREGVLTSLYEVSESVSHSLGTASYQFLSATSYSVEHVIMHACVSQEEDKKSGKGKKRHKAWISRDKADAAADYIRRKSQGRQV
jgi:hypothetical protein